MASPGGTVLLGVTGGIAAYKAADLASKLRQRGVNVVVAMTRSAQQFVTPLTFEYISNHPVITDLFEKPGGYQADHIAVTDEAAVAVIAPATANVIGKIANGIADDALTTIVMAFAGPLIIAPAMNERMYQSAALQENLKRLHERGVTQVGPCTGWLACGKVGIGRMAEVPEIVDAVLKAMPK